MTWLEHNDEILDLSHFYRIWLDDDLIFFRSNNDCREDLELEFNDPDEANEAFKDIKKLLLRDNHAQKNNAKSR